MTSRTRSHEAWARFYILNERNEPVQVDDHGEWSRWMEENDPVFRRTVLEAAGSTVTTRFRGVSEAAPVDTPLFITRVAGMPDPGIVLVHGSQPQVEEQLALRHVESQFVDGVRVTDNAALECAKEPPASCAWTSRRRSARVCRTRRWLAPSCR